MDDLAPVSLKNTANRIIECELRSLWNIRFRTHIAPFNGIPRWVLGLYPPDGQVLPPRPIKAKTLITSLTSS